METQQETKPELTTDQQLSQAVTIAVVHQRALDNLIRLDLRNYLNTLTAPGVSGLEKKQLKDSIERALMAAIDFGVDVVNQGLQEHGKLGKMESSFAAHIARILDNRMLILANNLQKQELTNNEQGEKTNE